MIAHVVVAGVPGRFYDQVARSLGSLQRADEGFQPIIVPFGNERAADYTDGYVRRVVARLASGVTTCQVPQTCLVTYLDYPSSELLCRAIHRFSLLAALKPLCGDELRWDREGEAVNRIARDVGRAYTWFREVVRAVGDEVDSGRRNHTPLLLPTRNFGSKHLDRILGALAQSLVATQSCDAARAMIKREVAGFLCRHPTEGEGKQRALSNGSIRFKSPGRHLHAEQHAAERHLDECRLGARIRLGHHYHKAFHYDVESLCGRFEASIPSCHGWFNVPPSSAYVNIAPNDHARKAG